MTVRSRKFAFIAAAVIAVAICLVLFSGTARRRPSVIFLVLDTTRADHLSAYGYPRPTTPNLDAIAKQGVLFEKHYVQGERTQSSMPQIYSSRYFTRNYIASSNYFMRASLKAEPPSQTEIFTVMREAGYRTGVISAHPAIAPRTFLLADRVDEMISVAPKTPYPHTKFEDLEPVIFDYLKRHQKDRFFLYVHALDPHAPNDPKPPFDRFVTNKHVKSISWTGYPLTDAGKETTSTLQSSPDAIQNIRDRYDGDLAYADYYIGRLWKKLGEMGLRDEVVFVVTSDHGEDLGDFGTYGHTHVEGDCMSHVPLIMTTPHGDLGRNVRVRALTEAVDILPSLIDYLGIRVPRVKRFDGRTFIPLVKPPSRGARSNGRSVVLTLLAPRDDGEVAGWAATDGSSRIVAGVLPGAPLAYTGLANSRSYNVAKGVQSRGALPPDVVKMLRSCWNELAPERKGFARAGFAKADRPLYFALDPQVIAPSESGKFVVAAIDGAEFWNDGKWLAAIGVDIRTDSFSEDVPPLSLQFEVPDGTYKVFVIASNDAGTATSLPYSEFGFRAEGERDFRQFKTVASGAKSQTLTAGTYTVKNQLFRCQVDDVRGRHMALLSGVVFVPVSAGDAGVDAEYRQKLKSLGYIQ